MKKVLSIILCFMLCLSVTDCKAHKATTNKTTTQKTVVSQETQDFLDEFGVKLQEIIADWNSVENLLNDGDAYVKSQEGKTNFTEVLLTIKNLDVEFENSIPKECEKIVSLWYDLADRRYELVDRCSSYLDGNLSYSDIQKYFKEYDEGNAKIIKEMQKEVDKILGK